jgi:hypothetical protein
MKSRKVWLMTLVGAYTLALLGVEYRWGQDYVRNYFTDLSGPVQFYGVNTTLSAFMLWAVALLFFVCWTWARQAQEARQKQLFYLSQVPIFIYLGADERFQLHELWGDLLDCNDAYFLLLVGLLEVAALFSLGAVMRQSRRVKLYLLCAALLFAVMIFFDVIVPDQMLWRLSIEDLTKLWSDMCLLLFAWEIYKQQIGQLLQTAKAERGI